MAATISLRNKILTDVFKNQEGSKYLGLSFTAINEDGTGATEPTAPSYKRLEISNTTGWNEAENGTITNSAILKFVETTESWTTAAKPITHWALFTAETGGEIEFYGALKDPREIPAGSIFEIPEEKLTTSIVNE